MVIKTLSQKAEQIEQQQQKNVLTSAFILKMTYILLVAEFLADKLKVCIYEELRLQTVRE